MQVPVRLLRCEWPPSGDVLPGNARFDALLASVRKDGIREPLTINLGWFIMDGQHRLAVARYLGLESVEVRVWTGMDFVS